MTQQEMIKQAATQAANTVTNLKVGTLFMASLVHIGKGTEMKEIIKQAEVLEKHVLNDSK